MLVAVLLVVLVVFAVMTVINQHGRHIRSTDGRGDDDPRRISDRRYAAGELSREECRQGRGDLDR